MDGSSRVSGDIIELGALDRVERRHALRVSRFCLRLFDDLQPLHRMGNTERIWLRTAALLHDIAKAESPRSHHKAAFGYILNSPKLPLRYEERFIVALIARYHRGSRPVPEHRHFGRLEADEQHCVAKLAALLRLADGLDKGRSGLVTDVRGAVHPQSVHLRVGSRDLLAVDKVLGKAALFEQVFGKRIVIHVDVGASWDEIDLDPVPGSAYAKAS